MAQRLPNDLLDGIPAIQATLDRYRVPGVTIAAQRGCDHWLGLYGHKSERTGDPVTASTAFNIASNTKAFTTAAVARLVSEGRLDWDDPVCRYLPEFRLYDAKVSESLTLRDVCSNRTGLLREGLIELGADPSIPPLDLLQRVRHLQPLAPPRVRFTYLNAGFMAAAAIVARVAGCSFSDYLTQSVLQPLGMHGSAGGARARTLADRAESHVLLDGRLSAFQTDVGDSYLGASSLYVCGQDALLWLRFQIEQGALAGERLIGLSAFQETHTPQIVIGPADRAIWLGPPQSQTVSYGLGWAISTYEGLKLLSHAGLELGATSHTCVLPEAGIGIAVYANSVSPAPEVIAYSVLDALLDRPPCDWNAIVTDPNHPSPLPPGLQDMLSDGRAPGAAQDSHRVETYSGKYRSSVSGDAEVTVAGHALWMRFEESKVFSGGLKNLGHHSFAVMCHPALAEELGGQPRVRFALEDGQPTGCSVGWLGRFEFVSG